MSVITESEIPAPPLTCGECWCEMEEASIGDIVQIDFLDHAQDSEDGPISCTVYGCVIDQGFNYITVASWQTHIDDFEDTTFTIVTSCITSLVVLKQQPSS